MKRVFVSDVHMSPGGNTYEWFDDAEAKEFEAFLVYLQNQDCDEVMLLGDILDVWIYPHNSPPASYQRIIDAPRLSGIFTAIQNLAKNKKVIYVPGNHDGNIYSKTNPTPAQKRFEGFGVEFRDSYEADGIYASHGHERTMWNALDPAGRTPPIGYYISRLIATIDSLGVQRYTFCNVANVLICKAAPLDQMCVSGPLDFLAPQANMGGTDDFVMPTGTPSVTLDKVKTDYNGLTKDWKAQHGEFAAARSIRREAIGLDDAATEEAFTRGAKVVLYGHTHDECNTPIAQPGVDFNGQPNAPYAIYANTGCWCDFNTMGNPKPYSYIEVETGSGVQGGTHKVTTKYWRDKRTKTNII